LHGQMRWRRANPRALGHPGSRLWRRRMPGLVAPASVQRQGLSPRTASLAPGRRGRRAAKKCGGGEQTQTRAIVQAPAHGGVQCPELLREQACNLQPCQVHCQVSEWSKWSACSEKCGGGYQTASRTITRAAAHGGSGCPVLTRQQKCNAQQCPFWKTGSFSQCSAKCGGGTRTREVKCSEGNEEQCSNNAKPAVSEPCNTRACPVDCVVSAWGPMSACSTTCGGGTQSQRRSIEIAAAHGGKACPSLTQIVRCNTHACPVHCVVGGWSSWSTCTAKCGGGTQTQKRLVAVAPANGGVACPALTQSQSCNTHACPINCVVGDWSAWSACSKTCGGGSQTQTREVRTRAAYGGRACPSLKEQQACNTHACPVNCVVSGWSAWSSCSATCGGGTQTQTRSVQAPAAHGGAACPSLARSQQCNIQACPVNCVVSSWSSWTKCSKTCGGGSQTQVRTVERASVHGGVACPALMQERPCNTQACPVNCKVSGWSDFSTCSKACGGGSQLRTRTIVVDVAHGGQSCPELTQSQKCNQHNCPVDCRVSAWSAWTSCSRSCGGGLRRQVRSVIRAAQYGGASCPSLLQVEDCSMQPCPVNCAVSSWGELGKCSKSCGGGEQIRERTVVVAAAHGGKNCPQLTMSVKCNTHSCPVDCKTSDWSGWSKCTARCGGGSQVSTRTVVTRAAHGGAACPVLTRQQSCNKDACPQWDAGKWSPCNKQCGGGVQTRKVTCSDGNQANCEADAGSAPPNSQTCNTHACPIDCKVSGWSAWSSCSVTCGGGSQRRRRGVLVSAAHGGQTCPDLVETQGCNKNPCPINCAVSGWSLWSDCSKQCGGGIQTQTRTVMMAAAYGGKECPARSQTRQCNKQSCPVDCVVGDWGFAATVGRWSPCSAKCGGGNQFQTRAIQVAAAFGGKACPALTREQACNSQACPVDCEVTAWSPWGSDIDSSSTAVAPPSSAVRCSQEHGECTIPAGQKATIYYGAGNSWARLDGQTGSVGCNNKIWRSDSGNLQGLQLCLVVDGRHVLSQVRWWQTTTVPLHPPP